MTDRAERLDFELLLDRLEEVIEGASRVPFGSRVMVDQQDCTSIIDQMRVSLPGQLDDARKIVAERDSILDQARLEAERIVEHARQQVTHEAMSHEIVREARSVAAEIEQRAAENSRRIQDESDEYARQVLQRLAQRIEAALRALKTGIVELERSRGPLEPRADPDYDSQPTWERRPRSQRQPYSESTSEPT